MSPTANNSGTAITGRHFWFIARDDESFKNMMNSDVWGPRWAIGGVPLKNPWVQELLTRKDRDILVRASDAHVFLEVWDELDMIRSAQYDELMEQRRTEKRMTAERLIEEVRRNG